MALISEKSLFIHIPKTGGSFVREVIPTCGIACYESGLFDRECHSGIAEIRTQHPELSDRFSIGFVRHPVSWIASFWSYVKTVGYTAAIANESFYWITDCWSENFETFVEQYLERCPGEVTRIQFGKLGLWTANPVNFIGRAETLRQDLIRGLLLAGETFDPKIITTHPIVNSSPKVYTPAPLQQRICDAERLLIRKFYTMNVVPHTMKSPRDFRPSIWRQGVLQIHVLRACDKACFNCTQGSNLGGKSVMITPEQFETACQSLDGYFGVVGMFGGNPALHPQFDELCRIMRRYIPYEQRGLWCNHPKGKGAIARMTFNPAVSNLNVHLDQEAHDEFVRDWPESAAIVKGLTSDSRHSPPWVAMQDLDKLPVFDAQGHLLGEVENTEQNRWNLIANCDVNQYWSSLIGVFRGELRAWFCELAGAQAMLHQHDANYPDTGLKVVPGWWNQGMEAFEHQARFHCHTCGIPLRGYGSLAVNGKREQVSQTHSDIYKPKQSKRQVQLVEKLKDLGHEHLVKATNYIENGELK